jgi:hypothetical protein
MADQRRISYRTQESQEGGLAARRAARPSLQAQGRPLLQVASPRFHWLLFSLSSNTTTSAMSESAQPTEPIAASSEEQTASTQEETPQSSQEAKDEKTTKGIIPMRFIMCFLHVGIMWKTHLYLVVHRVVTLNDLKVTNKQLRETVLKETELKRKTQKEYVAVFSYTSPPACIHSLAFSLIDSPHKL